MSYLAEMRLKVDLEHITHPWWLILNLEQVAQVLLHKLAICEHLIQRTAGRRKSSRAECSILSLPRVNEPESISVIVHLGAYRIAAQIFLHLYGNAILVTHLITTDRYRPFRLTQLLKDRSPPFELDHPPDHRRLYIGELLILTTVQKLVHTVRTTEVNSLPRLRCGQHLRYFPMHLLVD